MANPIALTFKEYLEMLCIEQADFKSLAITVRMELLAGFRQQSQSPPSAADAAAPLPKTSTKLAKTPSPPAESSALTADSELEIISLLPQGKQLDILSKAPSFKLLAETLKGPKYERLRCDFPKREIVAEWFRDLPADQRLALERLYICVADKRMIKEGGEMTVNYLFKTVFSDEVLDKYEEFIRAAFARGEGLSAITYRKSYFSLVSLITSLSGRHNSNVEPRHLASVMQARRRLLDHADSWNKETTLASNLSESDKILRTMNSTPPETVMKMLYFLLETQKIWFNLNFSKRVVQEHEVQRALGFVQFALLVARPVSRAETLVNVTLATVTKQLRQSGQLCWTFEETKVANTFGSLLCCFPEWLRPILRLYVATVRPILLRVGWGNGAKTLLFPQGLNRSFERFLNESCQASVNPSVIRQKCCEAIGLISEDSPYYKFRQDLQYTAQHKTSSQVVEKHYALSNKPSREAKLMEYLRAEFHEPAIELLREALSAKETRPVTVSSSSTATATSSSSARSSSTSLRGVELEAVDLLADLRDDDEPNSDSELNTPVPSVKTRRALCDDEACEATPLVSSKKKTSTKQGKQDFIVFNTSSEEDAMLVAPPSRANPGRASVPDRKQPVEPGAATAEDEVTDADETKLPFEFEEQVRRQTVTAFRMNFLFGAPETKGIIVTAISNTDAKVLSNFTGEELQRLAAKRVRAYAKNWLNTMPQKKLVKDLVDKKLPPTVASVKQICSRVNIDNLLSKHHAFRSRAPDDVIRRIQKDCEQRWVEYREHERLEEKQGNAPDSEGDFAGINVWRKHGTYACTRFQSINEEAGDSQVQIEQDYVKHTSRNKKRKRRTDSESASKKPKAKDDKPSDGDSSGGVP